MSLVRSLGCAKLQNGKIFEKFTFFKFLCKFWCWYFRIFFHYFSDLIRVSNSFILNFEKESSDQEIFLAFIEAFISCNLPTEAVTYYKKLKNKFPNFYEKNCGIFTSLIRLLAQVSRENESFLIEKEDVRNIAYEVNLNTTVSYSSSIRL